MFGGFNQQQSMQPQQNQFAPQQPAQLNYEGKPVHPYYLQQIQQILEFVHQAQNQPNLRNLMQLIEKEATTSKDVVDKASNYSFDSEQKMQNLEFNRSKCVRIKTRNSQILARIFNLRIKLTNNMNMYKTRSVDKQQEIGLIHQKIRDIKCSISYKYNRLKALKNRNRPVKEDTPILRGSGLHVPLVQLKKGVQLLQRETIRLREEIGLLLSQMQVGTI